MTVEDRVIAQRNQKRHDELCAAIKTEVPRFLAVGEMLIELRELGVYKETHKTFALFINEAFGLEKSRAYQLIGACELRQDLSTAVDKKEIPTNEAQLREVAKAPKEKQAEVVQIANEVAKSEDRKPTASDYRNAVEIVTAEPKRKEPEPELEAEVTDKVIDRARKILETALASVRLQLGHLGVGSGCDKEIESIRRKAGL